MSQPTDTTTQDVLLQTRAMDAYYGDFQALYGVDFHLNRGEAVAIIGANGAGKTTFLRAICGLLPSPAETVTFDGQAIGNMEAYRIVQAGIAMVPEGRRLFPSLSVEENLAVGGHTQRKGPWSLDAIYSLFPILGERRHQPGTQLSGGQQQMVAIGRALMSNPTLLLCDELSLGLAPIIVREIYQMLPRVREQGTSVLVVEQDIRQALDAADRVYCFQEGRVSLEGAPNTLTREQITQAYFGV
ncbi:ABC transporter ATP-binding protein [Hydrogenophaga sp. 5NK40-0174]|uniref:ABC transporter ATP-binding protein n=1 Tax=Hydrogenophaga sp. 5NK40-0174 TaxID=3127649 RepID=UPI0031035843